MKFLEVLAENKRLVYLREIADKYAKLYGEFNNQEKITIISASTLTSKQEGDVLAALQANPTNAGKEFTIEYKVDENIVGGLQMYTSSEFMDMSLASRVETLKNEVAKMTA
jgi:F-type H+-transporting ATPase subunit delta